MQKWDIPFSIREAVPSTPPAVLLTPFWKPPKIFLPTPMQYYTKVRIYFQVLIQNEIVSMFFGLSWLLFSEINSLALDKRRSEGTDDPGIAKYFLASNITTSSDGNELHSLSTIARVRYEIIHHKSRWRLHYYVILWVWFYGRIPVLGVTTFTQSHAPSRAMVPLPW